MLLDPRQGQSPQDQEGLTSPQWLPTGSARPTPGGRTVLRHQAQVLKGKFLPWSRAQVQQGAGCWLHTVTQWGFVLQSWCSTCRMRLGEEVGWTSSTQANNLFFFFFFRAVPMAYASSKARSRIGATAAGLHHTHSHSRIRATFVLYTTAHSNTGSLTH